jgi:hypothetical protein
MSAEVLDVAAARAAALAAQDWELVDAQLHPEFVYTNSQGARLRRGAYLDFLRDGPLRWRAQSFEDVHVSRVGSTAVLTGVVVDDVDVGEAHHVLRFATTQVYVLVEARWRYLAGQTAAIS